MKKYADNPLQVRLHHYQDNKLSEILNKTATKVEVIITLSFLPTYNLK